MTKVDVIWHQKRSKRMKNCSKRRKLEMKRYFEIILEENGETSECSHSGTSSVVKPKYLNPTCQIYPQKKPPKPKIEYSGKHIELIYKML